MKALIQTCNKQPNQGGLSLVDEPYFLKICGKMLIQYYLDFFYQLGVKEVFIASNNNEILKQRLLCIDTLNLDIRYIKSSSSKKSYLKNYASVKEDELIIIENFGFIKNNLNNIDSSFFKNVGNTQFNNKDFNLIYIKNHCIDVNFKNFKQGSILKVKQLQKFKDYFFISNHIFQNLESKYFLLGYSNNNGIIIGKNVAIEEGCELIAPIIIMDNVKICKNTILGPNTVINENAFIEEQCQIANSIVYDNTYINKNLKLDYKLISSNIIVDKTDERVYNIDEKFVTANSLNLLKF